MVVSSEGTWQRARLFVEASVAACVAVCDTCNITSFDGLARKSVDGCGAPGIEPSVRCSTCGPCDGCQELSSEIVARGRMLSEGNERSLQQCCMTEHCIQTQRSTGSPMSEVHVWIHSPTTKTILATTRDAQQFNRTTVLIPEATLPNPSCSQVKWWCSWWCTVECCCRRGELQPAHTAQCWTPCCALPEVVV